VKEIIMLNRTLKSVRIAALGLGLAAVAPTAVLAQGMDMSWAIRSQMQNQARGDAAANAAANYYYQYMLRLRAMGYTGPSLPTGVTQESLSRSINAANQAGINYNNAQQINSMRRSNATYDYSMRAIRGCSWAVDRYGNYGYVCP